VVVIQSAQQALEQQSWRPNAIHRSHSEFGWGLTTIRSFAVQRYSFPCADIRIFDERKQFHHCT